jgi:hypothetical protein
VKFAALVLGCLVLSAAAALAQEAAPDQVYSPKGDFTLTVPTGWSDHEPKTGDLELTHDSGANLRIDHGPALKTPGERATALIAEIRKRGHAIAEIARTEVTMDFMPGVQVHATGQADGAAMDCLITVVSGEERSYELISLGAHADLDAMKAAMTAVQSSFQRGE